MQESLFDYTQLDTETRIVVQQRTDEIKVLVRRSAQDIIDIGNKLIDIKERLGHGNFGGWLNVEFGWTAMTAQRFMQVADKFKNNNLLDLSIGTSALYLLAAPSTPDDVRAEAIERAQAGETITHRVAVEMVNAKQTAGEAYTQFVPAPPIDIDEYDALTEALAADEAGYTWTPDVYAGRATTALRTFFRYPGGKSKIAGALVDEIAGLSKPGDEYREPFVGGGGVFLPVLTSGKFRRFWINDLDYGIYCVWLSVRSFSAELSKRVHEFTPTTEAFYRFREALSSDCRGFHPAEVAFMKVAVHQMSYSGLGTRAGGPIGGAGQTSKYDVGCRWNGENIAKQIQTISAAMRGMDVVITCMDYRAMLDGESAVVYLDPPYYEQGNNLYQVGFTEKDHRELAERLQVARFPWLLSYDKCDDVRGLYTWANMRETEEIHYSIAMKGSNSGKQSRFTSEFLIAGGGH